MKKRNKQYLNIDLSGFANSLKKGAGITPAPSFNKGNAIKQIEEISNTPEYQESLIAPVIMFGNQQINIDELPDYQDTIGTEEEIDEEVVVTEQEFAAEQFDDVEIMQDGGYTSPLTRIRTQSPSQQVANYNPVSFEKITPQKISNIPEKEQIPYQYKKSSNDYQQHLRDMEIVERMDRIAASDYAKTQPLSIENLAIIGQGLGDKMRFHYEPNIFDDYLNPFVMLGDMAGGIAQVPSSIVSGNYGKAAYDVVTPLLMGAMAGQASKFAGTNFVDELFNPLAGLGKSSAPKQNFQSEIDWAKWNKEIPENKALIQSSNELPSPPHEIILDEHTINLERLAPKNKKKMLSFDDSDIGGGLTLRNNPSRVKNVDDILGKKRSIKSVLNKETGESIDLKTWKDTDGQLYYYMSANMPSSKIKAGKAYLELEKHIPKGASLLENTSLSYDSFLNILKQTKNPKFETFIKGKVSLNDNAKNNLLKIQGDSHLGTNYYKSEALAHDATNELNSLLTKYNLPEATVNPIKTSSGRTQMYEIQLPNIGLKKLYSIIGIGGAGALIQDQEYKNGGTIGNNGMFDMTNPNIYKALFPGAIGAGVLLNSNNNETQKMQDGGQTYKIKRIKK